MKEKDTPEKCPETNITTEKLKKDLSARFKKIEGQIRGVNRMVQKNNYCDDILNQIASIQAAVGSARNLILEQHIKNCITRKLEEGDEDAIHELMKSLQRMLK